MKNVRFHALLLFLLTLLLSCQTKSPPNIILFLVDDLGWQDTSVPFWKEKTAFNKRYHTPNMERLAAQGMKFTQAYATPVCSPTRISLMTGMNAARHRVTNWTLYKDQIQPMEANHEHLNFP
ncbi:MAG: sulfatase-like hydrolase/transferase, partial [Bacteroidota bacterium]